MGPKAPSHPISEAIAAEAPRYLAVIDHVLAMDYLKPDLRRRVIRMQRQLMNAEMSSRFLVQETIENTL